MELVYHARKSLLTAGGQSKIVGWEDGEGLPIDRHDSSLILRQIVSVVIKNDDLSTSGNRDCYQLGGFTTGIFCSPGKEVVDPLPWVDTVSAILRAFILPGHFSDIDSEDALMGSDKLLGYIACFFCVMAGSVVVDWLWIIFALALPLPHLDDVVVRWIDNK